MRSGLEPDPTYFILSHNKTKFIVGNGSKPFRIFHFATPLSGYSTVTDFARLRGLSTSQPRATETWYASICNTTTDKIGAN